jgi:hypothetical protein
LTQDRLPKSASTLHRLLGPRHNSVYFWHDAKNPHPVDLVVVDEASMVSLTMMAKLFDALPEKAHVILLGERDQLSSVEPGAVLGDIANAASEPGPLQGSLVVLEKNYRFGNQSNIFALSNAVRDGAVDRAGNTEFGRAPRPLFRKNAPASANRAAIAPQRHRRLLHLLANGGANGRRWRTSKSSAFSARSELVPTASKA